MREDFIVLPSNDSRKSSINAVEPIGKTVVLALSVGAFSINLMTATPCLNMHLNYASTKSRQFNIGMYNASSSTNTIDIMKIQNLDKIENMSCFEYDWNGNEGMPFSKNAIIFFRDIINSIYKQPTIAPTGRNSLYMQYKLTDKSLLVFEVHETSIEKLYVPNGNFELAETEIIDNDYTNKLNRCIREFYGENV